ncbi:MAG TPA: hypothetical protein VFA04_08645 [Bryobacteraceae bacterium]|nr:hypothetical protein [Bryobacteraceae bacterium]
MNDDFDFGNVPEPPPEAYEAVRRSVLATIRRRGRVRTAIQAVMAAAACILLVWCGRLLTEQPLQLTPPPPKVASAPAIRPMAAHVRSAASRRKTHRTAAPLLARLEKQPLLVKLQTDDPNVVILWMVD